MAVPTPSLGMVSHALGQAATPQPHDIAGHAVLALRRMHTMHTPAPPISRPSTDNGVMTASRFQGLFLTARVRLVAHADGAAAHRTALQAFRGPAKRVKTRHAQHDTT